MKLLLFTMIFIGFEIPDNLAMSEMNKDCWDMNKCLLDKHCGHNGKCLSSGGMSAMDAFVPGNCKCNQNEKSKAYPSNQGVEECKDKKFCKSDNDCGKEGKCEWNQCHCYKKECKDKKFCIYDNDCGEGRCKYRRCQCTKNPKECYDNLMCKTNDDCGENGKCKRSLLAYRKCVCPTMVNCNLKYCFPNNQGFHYPCCTVGKDDTCGLGGVCMSYENTCNNYGRNGNGNERNWIENGFGKGPRYDGFCVCKNNPYQYWCN